MSFESFRKEFDYVFVRDVINEATGGKEPTIIRGEETYFKDMEVNAEACYERLRNICSITFLSRIITEIEIKLLDDVRCRFYRKNKLTLPTGYRHINFCACYDYGYKKVNLDEVELIDIPKGEED